VAIAASAAGEPSETASVWGSMPASGSAWVWVWPWAAASRPGSTRRAWALIRRSTPAARAARRRSPRRSGPGSSWARRSEWPAARAVATSQAATTRSRVPRSRAAWRYRARRWGQGSAAVTAPRRWRRCPGRADGGRRSRRRTRGRRGRDSGHRGRRRGGHAALTSRPDPSSFRRVPTECRGDRGRHGSYHRAPAWAVSLRTASGARSSALRSGS